MADYIDRKAAIKLLTSVGLEVSDSKRRTVAKCINEIELMPTVDAVPVVRCRECKYSYEDISGRCCSHGPCVDWVVLDDSFCGQGERRTGNENR